MLAISVDTTTREEKSNMKYHANLGRWLVLISFLLQKNKTLLYTVDYHSKFPIVKQKAEHLTADYLIKAAKIAFAEFGLL